MADSRRNLVVIAMAGISLCNMLAYWFVKPTSRRERFQAFLKEDMFIRIISEKQMVDGFPVVREESLFWSKVYTKKILLIILQLSVLTIWCCNITRSCLMHLCTQETLQFDGLNIFSNIYLLAIIVSSIVEGQKYHSRALVYLWVLLTMKFFLMGTVSILPSPEGSSTGSPSNKALSDPWNIDLVCTFFAWLIVFFLPRGPKLHYPPEKIYSSKTISAAGEFPEANISDENVASLCGTLFFSYVTQVFMLGKSNKMTTFDRLPILPANLRASVNMLVMRYARLNINKGPTPLRSGFGLAYQLAWANLGDIIGLQVMSMVATALYFAPALFIQFFLAYLEEDPHRMNSSWGRFYVFGLFMSNALLVLAAAHQMSFSTNQLRTRLRLQLNTLLYAKTLMRKDAPSTTPATSNETNSSSDSGFSSKSEVMTLMTTDIGRAVDFSRLIMTPINATLGIVIGTYMLFNILGVSALVGLGIATVLIPLNQLAGRFVLNYQQNVMKCRDERTALTNEFLGGIRMIKSMAWERGFEHRVLEVRKKELHFQRKIFILETVWNSLGNSIPLLFALGAFWHFAVIRREELTPAIAFTAIVVIGEVKYPMMELPEFLVASLQAFVSLQRIENYLEIEEVETRALNLPQHSVDIRLQSATLCWPQPRPNGISATSTPRKFFVLSDVSASFPRGEISLICGRIGAGKSLLLLGLLGEADVVGGSVMCPRSSPDSYSVLSQPPSDANWVLDAICAYVPQTAWLRNATIKENILFNLPYDAKRYTTVLEACALVRDLDILEHGDESEIGEQGINLSGGQKARVSLARAVYSRASTLLLDDVLSALDFHTTQHVWDNCFKGDLMRGRTVILVSHHIRLCGPDSKLILALGTGSVDFCGNWESFQGSKTMQTILASSPEEQRPNDEVEEVLLETAMKNAGQHHSDDHNPSSTTEQSTFTTVQPQKKAKEESRFEGRISKDVWALYARSAGSYWYWACLLIIMTMGALSPLWENGWLKIWSSGENTSQNAMFYITVYTAIVALEIFVKIVRWLTLYYGSINASHRLYEKLLEAVLFANIRFHDTISRGWLLNRFGRDFEVVDNDLPNQLGWTLLVGAGLIVTITSLVVVGGWPFLFASIGVVAIIYFISRIFGQVARDLKRLSSTTTSPLFSIYGETISGLAVIRAFGMSTKFLNDMVVCLDTNMNPTYWSGGLHRWLTVRFQMSSGSLLALMAMVILLNPSIDASWAGLALAFASTLSLDMYWFVRRLVDSEQIMVSLERIKEYSDLPSQGPEFIEPRPPAAWPASGSLQFENVFVRYAPKLPDVLHDLSFEIKSGEKIGIIGRTGSGKSTVALSIMRFIDAREGKILIDGLDISKIGLTDLRRRLTLVPQDPMLLSGTLRSTLDVFGDYDDAEIFEALRRVNLIPSSLSPPGMAETSDGHQTHHLSLFSDLDTPVSELGDNFSTGEKQLLCMARALLRRSKILIMDEATASVDHATDEIISKTVRTEFADSTIITIAHRLRTVIDYDRIMVMDQGRIVEFDRPALLIQDETSAFYGLCKAAGSEEFTRLRVMVERKS